MIQFTLVIVEERAFEKLEAFWKLLGKVGYLLEKAMIILNGKLNLPF